MTKDRINEFAKRTAGLLDKIKTEEATKTSLILPFISMLGFDVFNPNEVIPEFTADVGIKKGEKVDYAIVIDDEPQILIEAKSVNDKLTKHGSQLFRYFSTTSAKFGILTNGIIYKFYTDLEEANKMDIAPFFEFNVLNFKDYQVTELSKFQKENFDVHNIFSTAEQLKYVSELKKTLKSQLEEPDEKFIKFLMNYVYDGTKTASKIEKFTPIVKKATKQLFAEIIQDKLNNALNMSNEEPPLVKAEIIEDPQEDKIVTTEEEIEGYSIVKSILRNDFEADRITKKDTESYFSILLDNNARKWIVRLKFNSSQKYLVVRTGKKDKEKFPIDSLYDIFKYEENIKNTLNIINSL